MEKISNIASKNLESLTRNNLTDAVRKDLTKDIVSAAATLSCLVAGLIYTYLLGNTYPIISYLLYFVGFVIQGVPIIITGLKGLLARDMNNALELLTGIAIVACIFDKQMILAIMIPLILNIAHMLEERSIMGGRDIIDGLKRMQQSTAILLEDGEEREVDAQSLKVGQQIVIKPGSGIPVDGVVISGETHIDQKSLTGEPEPAHAVAGSDVYAGTMNLDGRVVVEVKKEFMDTSFAKVLQLLENAENISAPESRIIDRFLGYYIPFILGVAAIVAFVSRDVSNAIAVLVVSCPCGQMLVSSAPMIAALSTATKRGVLIKNSKFIEELTEVDTVVFDKTGTVTKGELSLTESHTVEGVTADELLAAATAVAVGSTHPVSRAAVEAALKKQLAYQKELSIREVSGGGVEGEDGNGNRIRFGKREWLEEGGCEIPADFCFTSTGSVSYVAVDNKLLGCLCFADTLREEAGKSVEALRELGADKTVILTGDREEPARLIGEQVGVDEVYARLLPEDKLSKLRELSGEEHSVLAVGDGINDALALKEADVGIAMGAMGSDLAIESADIALMNNNLMNIPFVVDLAKRTKKIIYQNLAISCLLSLLMVALSSFGVINALFGSMFHNVGAFAVLINSSRLLRGEQKY